MIWPLTTPSLSSSGGWVLVYVEMAVCPRNAPPPPIPLSALPPQPDKLLHVLQRPCAIRERILCPPLSELLLRGFARGVGVAASFIRRWASRRLHFPSWTPSAQERAAPHKEFLQTGRILLQIQPVGRVRLAGVSRGGAAVATSRGPGFLGLGQTFAGGAWSALHPDLKPWAKGAPGLQGRLGLGCSSTCEHEVALCGGLLSGSWAQQHRPPEPRVNKLVPEFVMVNGAGRCLRLFIPVHTRM